jgi:hypothetical protein
MWARQDTVSDSALLFGIGFRAFGIFGYRVGMKYPKITI